MEWGSSEILELSVKSIDIEVFLSDFANVPVGVIEEITVKISLIRHAWWANTGRFIAYFVLENSWGFFFIIIWDLLILNQSLNVVNADLFLFFIVLFIFIIVIFFVLFFILLVVLFFLLVSLDVIDYLRELN